MRLAEEHDTASTGDDGTLLGSNDIVLIIQELTAGQDCGSRIPAGRSVAAVDYCGGTNGSSRRSRTNVPSVGEYTADGAMKRDLIGEIAGDGALEGAFIGAFGRMRGKGSAQHQSSMSSCDKSIV